MKHSAKHPAPHFPAVYKARRLGCFLSHTTFTFQFFSSSAPRELEQKRPGFPVPITAYGHTANMTPHDKRPIICKFAIPVPLSKNIAPKTIKKYTISL